MENIENKSTNDDDFGLPDVNPSSSGSTSDEPKRKPNAPQTRKKEVTSSGKKSIAPVIITLFVIVAGALVAVYFLFLKEPPKPVVVEKPAVDSSQFIVEKPVEAPVLEEVPSEPTVGEITILDQRTGKSFVVVGSFFDEDLANDYAEKLSKDGHSPKIIKPYGKNKFHRVAVEEFDNYNEAFMRAEALSQDFKEKPWALKY